ncbi:hypothetical protein [Pleurocapsa sp. FMAR1]|uniref:hypothetical protein n=1 Tax=Pleurocapsa sp. FMAR1 TaxID=3040204 RepID=UPI0029C8EDBE|nr:hypothetical protein [Pleurocapsa sp. FMAR1]
MIQQARPYTFPEVTSNLISGKSDRSILVAKLIPYTFPEVTSNLISGRLAGQIQISDDFNESGDRSFYCDRLRYFLKRAF